MLKAAIILLIVVLSNSPLLVAQKNSNILKVSLTKSAISDTTKIKPGLGNLFFSEKFDTSKIKLPLQWKKPEVAALIENDSTFASILIARYKDTSGNFMYFPDRNADNDFRDEKELVFKETTSGFRVADLPITIKSIEKNVSSKIIYFQLLLPSNPKEKDKYVYALQKEYWTATFLINNFPIKMELYRFFRELTFHKDFKGVRFYIDMNNDESVSKEQNRLNTDGSPIKSEQIADPFAVFMVNGTALKIKEIDEKGDWIELEKQNENTGYNEGFILPGDNRMFKSLLDSTLEKQLIPVKGGLTLLILSSKTCIPCERIRPGLNKLNDEYGPKGLNSYIMLKESGLEEVNEYLTKHEYRALPLLSNEVSWAKLNSQIIVPMFYIFDSNGIIVYKGIGAGPEQEGFLKWHIEKNLKGER